MPSLPDTAVIIFLGLLLFGPKGLAQIARQLGKLMGEFRRASNEFRMQMEEELRIAEQTDRQKQIAAVEAAAPAAPALASPLADESMEHQRSANLEPFAGSEPAPEPTPIATLGEMSIMPPATGLPAPRSSSLASLIDAVPKVDPPGTPMDGEATVPIQAEDQRPMRYANHDAANGVGHPLAAEESLHG